MGRKPKDMQNDKLEFSKFEITYQSGFERDWSKVLAGILFQQIKTRLEEEGDIHS